MTRDALAYHGCAELFQDVHTELILHRRAWMIKRRILKGNLSVDSAKQRLNGLCPLMPEEVGILLRAYGYKPDTIIYISGGEVFGGRKQLIPLHAMFDNLVDRTSLSTLWELSKMYGRETTLVDKYKTTPLINEDRKSRDWKTSGPRPRPLPPPPARPKSYNIEGWWGWVAESDNEPESSIEELRTNAHKLLWEAIDYIICLEADAFLAGFDRDGKGHPNFASLVMGHRLYQFAPSRTYNPNRKEIAKLFEEIRDTLYQANRTWITSIRKSLRRNLVDGLVKESKRTRPLSLLTFPIPECSCTMHVSTEKPANASSPSPHSQISDSLGPLRRCPSWMMNDHTIPQSKDESEEDLDLDDSLSSGLFFRQTNNNNNNNHEGDSGEISNKEEALVEDQEELEGGER
nr:O-fucosyltransferase 27 isoform X1 [Ipomoea batatas]